MGRVFSPMSRWLLTALVGCVLALAACDGGSGGGYSGPSDRATRIVSLAPALTQMVVDLGQGSTIVGVSEQDAAAPQGASVVGTYLDPNLEKILQLQPTLILTMTGKEGLPERLAKFADEHHIQIVDYPYPYRVREVAAILHDDSDLTPGNVQPPDPSIGDPTVAPAADPIPKTQSAPRRITLGAVLGVQSKAMSLRLDMLMSLSAINTAVMEHLRSIEAGHFDDRRKQLEAIKAIPDESERDALRAALEPLPPLRPSALVVIGTNPLRVVGPGQVLDDLLSYAGCGNAAVSMRDGAPTIDKETLLKLRPDVILIIDPNGQALASINDDARLAMFKGLDGVNEKGRPLVPAIANNRIILIDDPLAMLPSTSVPGVATKIAKAVHPEMSARIDSAIKEALGAEESGVPWKPEEVERMIREAEQRSKPPLPGGELPLNTSTPIPPKSDDDK